LAVKAKGGPPVSSVGSQPFLSQHSREVRRDSEISGDLAVGKDAAGQTERYSRCEVSLPGGGVRREEFRFDSELDTVEDPQHTGKARSRDGTVLGSKILFGRRSNRTLDCGSCRVEAAFYKA